MLDELGQKIIKELHPNVVNKLLKAKSEGKTIYEGQLSSDNGDVIESLFCTDSFEIENEKIYFNYLECIW